MAVVFDKPHALADVPLHYCPGCTHGIIHRLVAEVIDELQIEAEDITMDAELINDLGINSLELADLVLLCEERFHIEINDEEIHKFVTVGDVVRYLETIA